MKERVHLWAPVKCEKINNQIKQKFSSQIINWYLNHTILQILPLKSTNIQRTKLYNVVGVSRHWRFSIVNRERSFISKPLLTMSLTLCKLVQMTKDAYYIYKTCVKVWNLHTIRLVLKILKMYKKYNVFPIASESYLPVWPMLNPRVE